MRTSFKHILPALAAVLVAAAFALMCFFAPSAYADNSVNAAVVNDQFGQLNNVYGLGDTPVTGGVFVSLSTSSYNLTVEMLEYTVLTYSDHIYYRGSSYFVKYRNDGTIWDAGHPSVDFIGFFDTGIEYGGVFYGVDYVEDGNNVVGAVVSTPSGTYAPLDGFGNALVSSRNASGNYAFYKATAPLETSVPLSNYYSNHVKGAVDDSVITTTTTTTTTITTTTTTTVTLPPYPYETSPPFSLPDDWTADYSETTPTPSVPPVSSPDYSNIDDTLQETDTVLLPSIAFWFLLLGDFLGFAPSIFTILIVFTIIILLIISLMYHSGGDDK